MQAYVVSTSTYTSCFGVNAVSNVLSWCYMCPPPASTNPSSKALIHMHVRAPDQCHGAGEDELVVPLRLGDSSSDVDAACQSIDKYLGSSCGKGITRALVTGVLHYGRAGITHPAKKINGVLPVRDNITGYYGYRFSRTPKLDADAGGLVDTVVAHLKDVHGLTVTVRSEPNADRDMCVRNVMPAGVFRLCGAEPSSNVSSRGSLSTVC